MNSLKFEDNDVVYPDTSNEYRFHGTMEEFKKYMPELYDKMIKEKDAEENQKG